MKDALITTSPCLPAAFLVLLLFSCAGAPDTPAPWDASPAAIRQAFPDDEYIARQGTGETRAAAEANAAAQIAQFFNTQISSRMHITERYSEQNGNAQSNTEIETETFVQSQINLFGIRYARDAYFDRRLNEWVTAAYINRREAWEIYEPRLRSVTASFMAAYEAAGAADDPLSQYSRYRAAGHLGNENGGAADMLAYAQILYPEKAREYASVQNALAGISADIQAVLNRTVITVLCDNDFENIIAGAIIEAFRQGGFNASVDAVGGTNQAVAAIDGGRQVMEAGIFYTPRLMLTVSGGGTTQFTWTASVRRQGAWDDAVAKRGAWNALALIIKESLLREFSAAMEGGNL